MQETILMEDLKKTVILLSFLVTLKSTVQAQNLVVNPGFETHQEPKSYGAWMLQGDMFLGYGVKGWSQPTNGSSDYFYRADAASRMNISPYAGVHEPATGNAFAGFINWVPGREYREYLTGELSQPLEKGKNYVFKMKICTGAWNPYLVSQLGVYFTAERFKDNTTQFTVKQRPQVLLDVTPMHSQPETWIEIENVFTATGGEKYFTFGNFDNDSTVTITKRDADGMMCEFAYYYADDIVIEPTSAYPTVASANVAFSKQFEPGKTFIARGINFDLDKSTLRPESYLQLHAISGELKRKKNLKVEIRGYTDTTGNEAHNLQLSRARAKVVADYLVSTGIEQSRIKYGGYGSADPVSTTDVALNRRVEFRFE